MAAQEFAAAIANRVTAPALTALLIAFRSMGGRDMEGFVALPTIERLQPLDLVRRRL
jgi:hypothetical protein